MALPHPYGRLQFGADLSAFPHTDRHRLQPQRSGSCSHRIEDQWTNIIVEGIAKTGKPVVGFGIESMGSTTRSCAPPRQRRSLCTLRRKSSEKSARFRELWSSTKCGESDTTSGIASNPTVGNAFDKLYAKGCTLLFGETTEITVRTSCGSPLPRRKDSRPVHVHVQPVSDVVNAHKTTDLSDSQPTKGNIAGGLTTIEKRRSAIPESRQEVRCRRCTGQG